MQERERILELVKNGVISTQEGLDLLESLVKKEDRKQEKKDFAQPDSVQSKVENESEEQESRFETETDQDETEDQVNNDEEKAQIYSQLEKELENLAAEINHYSVELDQVNEKLTNTKENLENKKAKLYELKEGSRLEKSEEMATIRADILNLEKEISLIQKIDELDNTAEVAELKSDLNDKITELEKVQAETDPDKEMKIKELEKEIKVLEEQAEGIQKEKMALMKKLHAVKMKQWTTKAKQVSERLEIPENWKDEATETISKAGKQIEASGKELGKLIRESVSTSMKSDTAQSVKGSINSAFENFDWKDINMRVPKLASTTFEHEWTFEETTASILDFKLANGQLKIVSSDNDTIKVSAKVKLYGKINEETPLKAFEERSQIEIDDDKFVFHVPNKRIEAVITMSLPKRIYDYTAIKLLNGDVLFNEFSGKDVFVKSTNGDMTFKNTEAVMLEIKGTNGDVQVKNSDIRDFLVSTVNGNIAYKGAPLSSDVSTTNGDIKLTLSSKEMTRIKASSVNGDVKIAIPLEIDVEGEAKTVFGKVKSRLNEIDVQSQKDTKLNFRRIRQGQVLQLTAQTTSGNVLLKDTNESK
ncbi:DUF4097 and DUF4098 domain-containing protein YvlB [Marinilactibacillus piezotolerans]|uniref:DUF4097 and DUF4098 domain-containing protein YvlB n=1 Tax=Marinilactibacillus piezotolerans TaxID=258723 RepID=A0A1I3WZI3_9LACT|nr:daptomycin-sensing surface protein LiaX [Marinilactibacillus piezotolerans]SFK12902.1 DUF4097 and DUF4098 domain-containing protein YvlB [Marinilactibacillus piezotolerans]